MWSTLLTAISTTRIIFGVGSVHFPFKIVFMGDLSLSVKS